MRRGTRKILFLLVIVFAVISSAQDLCAQTLTFYAGYNGNTGNGGLDADVGLGGTAVIEIAGTPVLTFAGKHGGGLDADYTIDPARLPVGTIYPQPGNNGFYPGDDRVTYGGGANVPTSGTIEMWLCLRWTPPQQVNTSYYGDDQCYFAWAGDDLYTATNGFAIGCIYGNALLFRLYSGGTSYDIWAGNIQTGRNWDDSVVGGAWQAGEWHHLAMTWGSGGHKAFVDGVLWRQNTSSGEFTANPSQLTISRGENMWESADAVIDDVLIWDVERTSSEIQEDMIVGGTQSGILSGVVRDASNGQVIKGISVLAGAETAVTDDQGFYSLILPVGTYSVTAGKYGYKTAIQAGVVIARADTTTVDFQLQPTAVTHVSLGQARQTLNGLQVVVTNAVVTAVFPESIYVEEESRSAGLRISGAGSRSVGNSLAIAGTMGTLSTGERVLMADSVDLLEAKVLAPRPLGMLTRDVCGGPLGLAGGIPDATGLNTVGFLVRVWGRAVSEVLTDGWPSGGFYIDDGCSVHADVHNTGVKVYVSNTGLSAGLIGEFCIVTGIATMELPPNSKTPIRVICTRDEFDVQSTCEE